MWIKLTFFSGSTFLQLQSNHPYCHPFYLSSSVSGQQSFLSVFLTTFCGFTFNHIYSCLWLMVYGSVSSFKDSLFHVWYIIRMTLSLFLNVFFLISFWFISPSTPCSALGLYNAPLVYQNSVINLHLFPVTTCIPQSSCIQWQLITTDIKSITCGSRGWATSIELSFDSKLSFCLVMQGSKQIKHF